MSLKSWETKVLSVPGAAERVAQLEDALRRLIRKRKR